MADNQLTIKATIVADRDKIWDYYTLPEHITQWNFAIETWHCPNASNDLRKGGKYLARMEAKDGSFGFDFEAIYDEVVEPERISYTMSDGREAVIEFHAANEQTEVVITFDAETQNPMDMQRDGWQAILNNFKKYVETH